MKNFFQSIKNKYSEYKFLLDKQRTNSPINIDTLIKLISILASYNQYFLVKTALLPLFLIGYFSKKSSLAKNFKLILLCSIYYLLIKYYQYFELGFIKRSYYYKITALRLILKHCNKHRKAQIEAYLKIIDKTSSISQNNEQFIVKPLFERTYTCPLKVAIFGAKITQNQLDEAKKEFDRIIIIKPRSDLEIEKDVLPKQIILYYNHGDSYKNEEKIVDYVSKQKNVLTPNSFFSQRHNTYSIIPFTENFF